MELEHLPQPDLELRAVGLFLAVAETGSMTAAARRYHATQSAVSQAIAKLERKIGTALLERDVRPLRLTPAGETLRDGAPALLAAAIGLGEKVRDAAAESHRSIRLGLADSFAATIGPDLIRRLRGRSERISVLSGVSPTLWRDLRSQRLDFLVLTDPESGVQGTRRHELLREPFVLVLPKRLAANIQKPSLAALAANHPFIRYSLRSHIGGQIDTCLAGIGVRPPESMEFDGSEAMFAMVTAGLGWAITTPLCLVHARGKASDLVPIPLPGHAFHRILYLVSAPGTSRDLERDVLSEARDLTGKLIESEVRPWLPWAAEAMRVLS